MIFRRLRRLSRYWIPLIALLGVYLLSTILLHVYSGRGEEHEVHSGDVLMTSPFVKDDPKLVILLSYQRSGSTFVGEWFNNNLDVFYNFEPVDSLYSAMYGTPQNANVPSDITNYPNGSSRLLPDEELNAVSDFLLQFLHCDLDNLPTQALMNFYLIISPQQFRAAENYTRCLRETFSPKYTGCEYHLTRFCGSRFGEAPEVNQKECFRRLWLNQDDQDTNPVDRTITHRFTGHQSCLENRRIILKRKCQNLLSDVCRNHTIRVIKTVRATMESMEPLLKKLPNFRVIHLVRDPRAVALSRKLFKGNVRGIYSGNDTNTITKEAKLYCSTVVRDIKARQRLEREYPGKIYTLSYDKLVTNTSLYLEQVYEFLDATPPYPVVKWLKNINSKTNKTSEEISKQWENVISVRVNEEIIDRCREFFQMTPNRRDL